MPFSTDLTHLGRKWNKMIPSRLYWAPVPHLRKRHLVADTSGTNFGNSRPRKKRTGASKSSDAFCILFNYTSNTNSERLLNFGDFVPYPGNERQDTGRKSTIRGSRERYTSMIWHALENKESQLSNALQISSISHFSLLYLQLKSCHFQQIWHI